MKIMPSHKDIAIWISEKRYLTENCHDANTSTAITKIINSQLSSEQEKLLLKHPYKPPFGSIVYKASGRSFVGEGLIGDKKLVLKYYHRRSLRRQIGYTLLGSHGMKAWIASRVLIKLGICTPQPIAILEHRKFGFLMDACLVVTEIAKGVPLPDYIRQYSEDEARLALVLKNCKNIFDRFAEYRIYHKDPSAINFIVDDDCSVSVIDLDTTHILVPAMFWRAKRAKDQHRFMRVFRNEFPQFKEMFESIFIDD